MSIQPYRQTTEPQSWPGRSGGRLAPGTDGEPAQSRRTDVPERSNLINLNRRTRRAVRQQRSRSARRQRPRPCRADATNRVVGDRQNGDPNRAHRRTRRDRRPDLHGRRSIQTRPHGRAERRLGYAFSLTSPSLRVVRSLEVAWGGTSDRSGVAGLLNLAGQVRMSVAVGWGAAVARWRVVGSPWLPRVCVCPASRGWPASLLG
jgi:hypothetical protein